MLSMDDLLDYCDLDRDEIEAIAEHEHIPLSIAAGLGDHLLGSADGVSALHAMLLENIQQAVEHGHREHADELATTYRHLQRTHPLPNTEALSARAPSLEARA
jgi:hypothetical protein